VLTAAGEFVDVVDQVADALQIRGRIVAGHDDPQVRGARRVQYDHVDHFVADRDFQAVDRAFVAVQFVAQFGGRISREQLPGDGELSQDEFG
jgi:hypothetical protein